MNIWTLRAYSISIGEENMNVLIIISCIYIILSYKTKGAPLPTGVAKCVCVPHHSLDPK